RARRRHQPVVSGRQATCAPARRLRRSVRAFFHSPSNKDAPVPVMNKIANGIPIARFPRFAVLALALCAGGAPAAFAQQAAPDTVAELRAEIAALRAEQAERDQRLQRLESALQRMAGEPAAVASGGSAVQAQSVLSSPAAATPVAAATPASSDVASRLKVSGDLRLRGQADWSDDDRSEEHTSELQSREK